MFELFKAVWILIGCQCFYQLEKNSFKRDFNEIIPLLLIGIVVVWTLLFF